MLHCADITETVWLEEDGALQRLWLVRVGATEASEDGAMSSVGSRAWSGAGRGHCGGTNKMAWVLTGAHRVLRTGNGEKEAWGAGVCCSPVVVEGKTGPMPAALPAWMDWRSQGTVTAG